MNLRNQLFKYYLDEYAMVQPNVVKIGLDRPVEPGTESLFGPEHSNNWSAREPVNNRENRSKPEK